MQYVKDLKLIHNKNFNDTHRLLSCVPTQKGRKILFIYWENRLKKPR